MRGRRSFSTPRPVLTRRLALAALAVLLTTPLSASAAAKPAYGTTTVFATVPAPGHPFGVLATRDAVYVATGAGRPIHPNAGPEVVFKYRRSGGAPIATVPVPTMATMGLHDLAEDGDGRVYVVDMNSRILRFSPGSTTPEVYAMVPEPYMTLGWPASMWQNLAFDRNGDLYVTDASLGAIWRIPPNGMPEIWFRSTKFVTFQMAGINGIAVGPDHMLYVVLASAPAAGLGGEGALYRLPISVASPAADQLEMVHRFPMAPGRQPTPFPVSADLAFGRSGRAYVTLSGTNEIAVVDLAEPGAQRITSPLLDFPIGIRFLGDSLLIANSNYMPENPDHWQILKVYVGETGLPLLRPRLPRR